VLDNQCLAHSALVPQQITMVENENDPSYLAANNDDEIAALGGATRSIAGKEKPALEFPEVQEDWEEEFEEKEEEEEEDWEEALRKNGTLEEDDWEAQLQDNAKHEGEWAWKKEAIPEGA